MGSKKICRSSPGCRTPQNATSWPSGLQLGDQTREKPCTRFVVRPSARVSTPRVRWPCAVAAYTIRSFGHQSKSRSPAGAVTRRSTALASSCRTRMLPSSPSSSAPSSADGRLALSRWLR